MPELPEVETVRRGLDPVMSGATFMAVEQRRADLRFPFPADFVARLTGRRVERIERRAKYLRVALDDGMVLVMHLGMSGSFRIEVEDRVATPGVFHHPRSTLGTHDHVVFTLSNGVRVVYNDPRRFGFMLLVSNNELGSHPFFARVGIEPLGDELDGAALARLFAGKTTPLKAALLDQTLIAGLGNIYVCEALYRAACRRAAPPARSRRPTDRRPRGRSSSPPSSRKCCWRRLRRVGRRCAIIVRPTAASVISSIVSKSTIGSTTPARTSNAPVS